MAYGVPHQPDGQPGDAGTGGRGGGLAVSGLCVRGAEPTAHHLARKQTGHGHRWDGAALRGAVLRTGLAAYPRRCVPTALRRDCRVRRLRAALGGESGTEYRGGEAASALAVAARLECAPPGQEGQSADRPARRACAGSRRLERRAVCAHQRHRADGSEERDGLLCRTPARGATAGIRGTGGERTSDG